MPIAALPPNAVRAIGSSQALTDAASVVKELIDNALDARASAIYVEISANTLDVIQVKDNGHGIGPDDRDMVCRRFYTSKIRDLADLENIGGSSLGFRGEALASAAEMSGGVVVTTRVEGEAVAVASKFGRQGEREGQERASHPVGTSVRLVDFLNNLPVRRQTALKSSAATLSKIKRTLKAYAIARPSTRFSLKVLKARTEKDNWVYAPKVGACVSDAAIKVVGKKVAGQSHWITRSQNDSQGLECSPTPGGSATARSSKRNDNYTIETFLPKPQCDLSVINNSGHYVSIDSRPVSCTRGVLKQMIGLYKSHLRSACPSDNDSKLVEPFICMNITCPTGSYDANVEPAKDDVLFTDPEGFLATLGQFFRTIYGELQPKEDNRKSSKQTASRPRGFELLLARKPQVTTVSMLPILLGNGKSGCEDQRNAVQAPQTPNPNQATVPSSDLQFTVDTLSGRAAFQREASQEGNGVSKAVPSPEPRLGSNELSDVLSDTNQKRMWQHNMYSDDYEQDDGLDDPQDSQEGPLASEDANEAEDLRDTSVSNPWTIAKLNAPIHTRLSDSEARTGRSSNEKLLTPGRQRGDISNSSNVVFGDRSKDKTAPELGLPTPGRSQRFPSTTQSSNSSPLHPFPFPMKAWGKGDHNPTPRSQKGLGGERYSAGALDTWVQKSLTHDPIDLEGLDSSREDDPVERNMLSSKSSRDFVSARTLPLGTPLSAIPDVFQRPKRRPAPRELQQNINKPFVSPVNDPGQVWFEMGPSRRPRPARPSAAQRTREAIAATAPIRYGSEDVIPTMEDQPGSAARPSPKLMHPDLALTMDYEIRKQAAMQKRKEFLRQQALDARLQREASTDEPEDHLPTTNSPHKNRYNAAVASLSSPNPTTTTIGMPSALEDSDPRAYLLRVQQRDEADRQSGVLGSSRRLRRRKTTMLPLETTPGEATVLDLVLVIETTKDTIGGEATERSACDEYIRSGRIGDGFASLGIEDVRACEGRARGLVEENYRSEGGEKVSVEIDLRSAVQGLGGMDVAVEGG
ncbi:MAG: hypothetical protein FRX48_00637 [Lasallia pustulata]|uniref:DNA mismatch repair protein S5 domain-containing protein n=1 Tax=Lasallia pustulata TaxID=136370 RepID=A0A5M8Q1E0_9LECA|nr:MAG: hypothetical protein FRX48_00637 [Lasallia pustulata]